MKLFIGGAFQGKKKAAMERTGLSETDFLDGESCTKEELLKGKAITHFHSCIRRILREEGEEAADAFAEELFRENPGLILVSTELGYGIVPMDPFDRLYREKVGRILCRAAEQADEVCRVVAGRPVCIKGEKA